jgi:hypothetical protein
MSKRDPFNYKYESMADFSKAVAARFGLHYADQIKALDKITRKTAKEMAKAIEEASPKGETKKYSQGWTIYGEQHIEYVKGLDTLKTTYTDFTVYNKSRYMLTHLLEDGHNAGKDQHWVPGKPHIEKVVREFNEIYIDRIADTFEG